MAPNSEFPTFERSKVGNFWIFYTKLYITQSSRLLSAQKIVPDFWALKTRNGFFAVPDFGQWEFPTFERLGFPLLLPITYVTWGAPNSGDTKNVTRTTRCFDYVTTWTIFLNPSHFEFDFTESGGPNPSFERSKVGNFSLTKSRISHRSKVGN